MPTDDCITVLTVTGGAPGTGHRGRLGRQRRYLARTRHGLALTPRARSAIAEVWFEPPDRVVVISRSHRVLTRSGSSAHHEVRLGQSFAIEGVGGYAVAHTVAVPRPPKPDNSRPETVAAALATWLRRAGRTLTFAGISQLAQRLTLIGTWRRWAGRGRRLISPLGPSLVSSALILGLFSAATWWTAPPAPSQEPRVVMVAAPEATKPETKPEVPAEPLPPGLLRVGVTDDPVGRLVGDHWRGVDPVFVREVEAAVASGRLRTAARAFAARARSDIVVDYNVDALLEADLEPWLIGILLVESWGCRQAVSHTGALGPWQFTTTTARTLDPGIRLGRPDPAALHHAARAAAGTDLLNLAYAECPEALRTALQIAADDRTLLSRSTQLAVAYFREMGMLVDREIAANRLSRHDRPLFVMTAHLQGPRYIRHAASRPGATRWSEALKDYHSADGTTESLEDIRAYPVMAVAALYVAVQEFRAQPAVHP